MPSNTGSCLFRYYFEISCKILNDILVLDGIFTLSLSGNVNNSEDASATAMLHYSYPLKEDSCFELSGVGLVGESQIIGLFLHGAL